MGDHSFKQVFRNTLKKILILSFISKCNKIMGRVQDKVILVSAAGQGIGRASCLFLAREGAKVIATDFNNESLESLRQEAVNENLDIKVLDGEGCCCKDSRWRFNHQHEFCSIFSKRGSKQVCLWNN